MFLIVRLARSKCDYYLMIIKEERSIYLGKNNDFYDFYETVEDRDSGVFRSLCAQSLKGDLDRNEEDGILSFFDAFLKSQMRFVYYSNGKEVIYICYLRCGAEI